MPQCVDWSHTQEALVELTRGHVCRSLTGGERNLLWRFRWSLTGERQALTRVLQCVDWSDVQEARQAAELMASWTSISVADALELLSPAFPQPEVWPDSHAMACRLQEMQIFAAVPGSTRRSELPTGGQHAQQHARKPSLPCILILRLASVSTGQHAYWQNLVQVRAHAVEVLQGRGDDEVQGYLLQLVQVRTLCSDAHLCSTAAQLAAALWNARPVSVRLALRVPHQPCAGGSRAACVHCGLAHFMPLHCHTLTAYGHCLQALRYEAAHDSRLAAFLISCAQRSLAFAISLHWCVALPFEAACALHSVSGTCHAHCNCDAPADAQLIHAAGLCRALRWYGQLVCCLP